MTPKEKKILKSLLDTIEKLQIGTEPLSAAIRQYHEFLRAIETRILVDGMASRKN